MRILLLLPSLLICSNASVALGSPLPLAWEISLPSPPEIKNQGRYPYCGLHSMASYLELWNKGPRPSHAYPALDESFLAMAYNRTVGSGSQGTHPLWLAASTQLYGVIPKGVVSVENNEFPRPNWEREHLKLMDKDLLRRILRGSYRDRSGRVYTGQSYGGRVVRMDFRQSITLHSNRSGLNMRGEPIFCRPSQDRTEAPAALYRHGDLRRTVFTQERLAERVGIDPQFLHVTPRTLYQAIGKQLYKRRPVYLGINVGLTRNGFAGYRLITRSDLVPEGQGNTWMHAVVAVAHCDNQNSRLALCRRFSRYLERKNTKSCIVIQNSWGKEVHQQGYVCLSSDAVMRLTRTAMVQRNLMK